MLKRILFVSVAICIIMACSSNDNQDDVPSLGYEFFPLESGKTYIYRVDSLGYDNNTGSTVIDTFTYFYKVQIGEYFTDLNNERACYINRFYADSLNGEWNEANTWVALRNANRAEQVEENIRFVKLVFPVSESKTWDGNMMNNLGFERYRITDYRKVYQQYGSTITVQQQNDSNAIEVIRKQERYAAGVGLVYLKSDSLNTQTAGSRGYRYQLTLISYQ